MNPLPDIAIVGLGAIGSLLTFKAKEAGLGVENVTREAECNTLAFEDLEGHVHEIPISSRAIFEPIESDIILLPLKAYQIAESVQNIKDSLRPQQVLVLLHNGMGTLEQIQAQIPDNPVVAATTSYAALKTDKYHGKATGLGKTHAGWAQNENALITQKIKFTLDQLLPPCQWHQTVSVPLWHKLAVNAVINPLTAIHDVKNGELLSDEYQSQIKDLCAEVAAVMTANQIDTSTNALVSLAMEVARDTADNSSSMRQDVKHHRQTEIDFINGFVLREGKRLNVATPANAEVTERIKQISKI